MKRYYFILIILIILFTFLGIYVWGPKNNQNTYENNDFDGFVTAGDTHSIIALSSNVESWSEYTSPFDEVYTVEKGGGIWVAAGLPTSGGHQLAWSFDGQEWTQGSGSDFGTASTAYGITVAYGNGRWVAGGVPNAANQNTILYSDDGKVWHSVTGTPFGTTSGNYASIIQYLNGKWIAGGSGGDDSEVKIWFSDDGINWTSASGNPFGTTSGNRPTRFAYGGGIYVAVGYDFNNEEKTIWYSSDLDTWTTVSSNPFDTGTVFDVVFYDGLFVSTGVFVSGGTGIAWSSDGETWTASTGVTFNFISVTYSVIPPSDNNTKWFACGLNNISTRRIYSSTDGKAWEVSYTESGGGGTTFLDLTSGNGKVVAVGKLGDATDVSVYSSDNGDNWSKPNGLTEDRYSYVVYRR